MSRIKISRPAKAEIDRMGVESWGTWGCEASTFDWEYDATETCFILEGEVKVKTDQEEVWIKPGDLVTFPQGLKCVWEVKAPIRKHFRFD
ncbi:MAG: cupin domain-containing protein [Proteobacteria bacterium]|nr:cupin domain-containing protein [Pseudomonadota bacterium]MBU1742777.1 cupin domain-containing protein [Pseudomonadota bacterium]